MIEKYSKGALNPIAGVYAAGSPTAWSVPLGPPTPVTLAVVTNASIPVMSARKSLSSLLSRSFNTTEKISRIAWRISFVLINTQIINMHLNYMGIYCFMHANVYMNIYIKLSFSMSYED